MHLISQNLPNPSEEEIFLSNQLKNQLIALIKNSDHNAIAFSEYMKAVLFSELGYYKNGTEKFGAKGDFITAPEISPIFAQLIAPTIEKAFKLLSSRVIVEFGSGSGALMVDLMQYFAAQNRPIERYYLLDISGDLKARQKERLTKNAPELLDRVVWLDSLHSLHSLESADSQNPQSNLLQDQRAVVIANEVLDTFSLDCFIQNQSIAEGQLFNLKGIEEKMVAIDDGGQFCFKPMPLSEANQQKIEALNQQLDDSKDYHYFANGYFSELPADYSAWLSAIKNSFKQAVCLLIDYGLSTREYYSPDRNQGTLRCYYRHLLHNDPFYFPGTSDITSSVNFSKLLSDATQNNMDCLHYTTQGQFLLNGNFEDILAEAKTIKEQMQLTSDFKKLILPTEMGEIFKVMMLTFSKDQKEAIKAEDFDLVSRDFSYRL